MKTCRVSFRDLRSVEHSVVVEAAHRYHAFGLAMERMRQCSWCNPDYHEVERLTIQLLEGPNRRQKIAVTRQEFEEWLSQKTVKAQTDRTRQFLLMLLGRIPPDREFKRFMADR